LLQRQLDGPYRPFEIVMGSWQISFDWIVEFIYRAIRFCLVASPTMEGWTRFYWC